MNVADRLLRKSMALLVTTGSLELITASGLHLSAGNGQAPHVVVRLTDQAAAWAILLDPELALGELFVEGRLLIEHGSIYDLLQLLLAEARGNRSKLPIPATAKLREIVHRLGDRNTLTKARRRVSHHYDLGNDLYDLFLDTDRQYSCAYYDQPHESLDEAQRAKERHIAAKLRIEPGDSVLDIGCGWGGMALYLAETAGAGSVKGITLSREQLAIARRSATSRGLSTRVAFELEDYRTTTGQFDRIVSVGMFEHVGPSDYDTYFQACRRLLADDGAMLLHTIGKSGGPAYTNPWIRKYIFPGGHIPALSEMLPAIERAGLIVTDVEVLRLHYAETLRAWRERFLEKREEAAKLYDERFCRMWECYLAMSESAFRFQDEVVFQIQLAVRNDALPITRTYMTEQETDLMRDEVQVGQGAE